MSRNIASRRAVLKRGAVVIGGVVGTGSGSALAADGVTSQQTKSHYIEFSIENGDGNPQYFASVPDPNPTFDGLESDDEVTYYDTYTTVDGELHGNFSPYQDEIEFDGSLDDDKFSWDADPEVRVIVDGEVVKSG